jgi:frataxin-like iron-binding protein CyaY
VTALPPLYSREETARRGQEIYERDVRPAIEATHQGQFVAIDIESGIYELDTDDFSATEHLLTRQPAAQIWLARVGHTATYRIGGPRSTRRGAA